MTGMVFANRYKSKGVPLKGGGGDVYICVDPNLERTVAVKFLRTGVDKSRLQDEVASLQKIRSKNVVQILDLVDDSTLGLGIVVEYLCGEDLTHDAGLPTDRNSLLLMVYQLANGLTDIHAAGIVHRDLKPNNVKYGEERILKIFDFNLARDEAHAVTEGFRGTHGFAAPEQYGSGVVRLSTATDVFSLAALCAYLANGGSLPNAFKTKPPDPTKWSAGFAGMSKFDEPLAALLDEALALEPSIRPTAEVLRNMAGSLLRRDAHRATLTVRNDSKTYQLDAAKRTARLAHSKSGGGVIELAYSGLAFEIKSVSGAVFVNHRPCAAGDVLPDSCVIDLGSPSNKTAERLFVTFDLSHPEVVQ